MGRKTVLLNNDRLSHWLAGAALCWTVCLLLLFIPIFHLLLGFSIAKIVVSAGICCAVQLAATPWLFSARATRQNPSGRIARRAVVVIVWLSLTALLLFYYFQRGWPNNSNAQVFRACGFGTIIALAFTGIVVVLVVSRQRGNH
jgi:hypothetical protein